IDEPGDLCDRSAAELLARDDPGVMGCNVSWNTRDEAIANVRRAFRAYLELLDARGVAVEHWKGLDSERFAVAENSPEGPFYPEDKAPLEEHDLRDFLHVFEVQQAALIALVSELSVEDV